MFACVDEAVARAYTEARLRKSVVRDALVDRANTGDNTPAFTDIHFVEEPGARVHVLLKGGGSDNASRVTMLTPGAGREGIIAEVMDCVAHKAANACPPLVIGIGVGGTFDKVAGMAKSALLREVGTPAADPRVAEFERELLEKVNASGMGPGALGGKTLALAVHVNTAPCHIAALPLAINMGCSAMRRATVELDDATPSAWPPVAESGRRDDEAKGHMEDPQEENGRADASDEGATAGAVPVKLALPLDKSELAKLKAGDACTLTGEMYMLRDAGHIRLPGRAWRPACCRMGLRARPYSYAGHAARGGSPVRRGGSHHGLAHGFRRPRALSCRCGGHGGQGRALEGCSRRMPRNWLGGTSLQPEARRRFWPSAWSRAR